jgi:hypothetical protein
MIRFKLLGTVAALSTFIAVQPPAFGGEGRQITAPPWSFACMNDQGPSECGEPMWVYGGGEPKKQTSLTPHHLHGRIHEYKP